MYHLLVTKYLPDKFIYLYVELNTSNAGDEKTDIFTRTFKVERETEPHSFQFKLVNMIINCKKVIRYENKSITEMFILW